MNSSPKEMNDEIISVLSDNLNQLKMIMPKLKIHFELGAFTDDNLMGGLL